MIQLARENKRRFILSRFVEMFIYYPSIKFTFTYFCDHIARLSNPFGLLRTFLYFLLQADIFATSQIFIRIF